MYWGVEIGYSLAACAAGVFSRQKAGHEASCVPAVSRERGLALLVPLLDAWVWLTNLERVNVRMRTTLAVSPRSDDWHFQRNVLSVNLRAHVAVLERDSYIVLVDGSV